MELLANMLRPKSLNEIIGQQHLVADGKVLNNMVKNKKIFSFILYGNPGTGKTSIASAMAQELNIQYKFLNATINNKSEIDAAIAEAKLEGEMILIIDEIHRMHKDKQDLLLPYVESGLIILIGLTTSNPYYKINKAIRSRVQIFHVEDLNDEDILEGINRACKYLKDVELDNDAIKAITAISGGDVRTALNLLEVAYYSSPNKHITKELIKEINDKPVLLYDKDEDGHYDTLSALQKSIRGSDENASLYYLAKLIEAGDLDSIYRRLSVIAYEDIGLANPSIGPKVMAAISASELVGLPEARIPLGTIVTEMALSPKSNSAHIALDNALNDIRNGNTGSVPDHIKSSSKTYKYPHDYANSYVKQQYLPEKLKGRIYYYPKNNKYENNLNKLHREIKGDKK